MASPGEYTGSICVQAVMWSVAAVTVETYFKISNFVVAFQIYDCLSVYLSTLTHCTDVCCSVVNVQCVGHDRAEYDNLPAGVQVSNRAARGAVHRHCTQSSCLFVY